MIASEPTCAACCAVLELRQYTLKPGRRDALIDLFERHFIESQEAVGMTVAGHFRDRDRDDRFVWIRGFADMNRRRQALEAFYDGPVWARHRDAANGTMLDSDDVLLLRPAGPGLELRLDAERESSPGSTTVLAAIHHFPGRVDRAVVLRFERDVAPVLGSLGVRLRGVFVTEDSPNTFTRLPVREGEHVLVWFGTTGDQDPARDWTERLAGLSIGDRPPSVLTLDPASRSVLGNGPASARATRHDFDFLLGRWHVHNRFLAARLCRSNDWLEFDARSAVQPLLDGFGHVDRYSAVREGRAMDAVTVRLFDPSTGEWSLYWADTVRARTFLPPMIGRFAGGSGEFFGEERVDGRLVLCRFRWSGAGTGSPRWEQAFSDDGGASWETNWVMNFARL